MKVDTKIAIDTMGVLVQLVGNVYTSKPVKFDKMEKVYRSITFELADKFEKQYKAFAKKHNNLFDCKKKIKLSVKVHEAWALTKILPDLADDIEDPYYRNGIKKLVAELDQKIA